MNNLQFVILLKALYWTAFACCPNYADWYKTQNAFNELINEAKSL